MEGRVGKHGGAEAFCTRRLLRATSRTFALSIEQLPARLRRPLAVAYLLLRVSDYIEDHDVMDARRKAELLHLWADVLENKGSAAPLVASLPRATEHDAEGRLAQQAEHLLRELDVLPHAVQDIMIPHVVSTTRGMARWQERGPRVRSEEDLDDYMHCVAGIVGYLVTELFAWYSDAIAARKDRLIPLAREFGLALQTVNVIRGLRTDYERGWIFVPQKFCAREGLHQHELFERTRRAEAMQVVGALADKAEAHLENGLRYVAAIPRRHYRIRLACMWPLLFAAKTLALSRHEPGVLDEGVKISRAQVRSIVLQSSVFGWSNAWLKRHFEDLSAHPRVEGSPAGV